MAYCLKIISSRLLLSEMSADTCIPRCSSEIFTFSIWNMLSFAINVAFCQPEVDNENSVLIGFIYAYQKIVWLYVTMNNFGLMHLFYHPYL